MIDYTLRGGHYRLYFNGEALFNAYDKFGREKDLVENIEGNDKEAYENLIWLLCELSRQGELYTRFMGGEAGKPLEYIKTCVQMQPREIKEAKEAVLAAIKEGFLREHPDEELEEDAFLQEFESQKKTKFPGRSISGRSRKASGSASKKA